jgi:hypothetical protein
MHGVVMKAGVRLGWRLESASVVSEKPRPAGRPTSLPGFGLDRRHSVHGRPCALHLLILDFIMAVAISGF